VREEGVGAGVDDPLVHEMATHGEADLALVEERAPGSGARGRFDVGVVEHEVGVVAAELERDPLELPAGGRPDQPAGPRRAGEADHVDPRIADDRFTGGDPTRQDVQEPGR
jgi:hypothetical protein